MAQEVMSLLFGDGEYDVRLTIHGIKEIQEKCGCGIGKVWSRLAASRLNHLDEDIGVPNIADFRIEDIIEPIRQGLLGGGRGTVDECEVKVTPTVANRLIENYVINRPLQEGWRMAYAIVGGLVEGWESDKKKVAENPEAETDDSTTQAL